MRKNFVPIKFIGHIYPQYFSLSKYFIFVCGTYGLHQEETCMRQRNRHPQAVSGARFFECCILSFDGIIKTVAQIMCLMKTDYNLLELTFWDVVLKTKRSSREDLSLAKTERDVQFKFLCVKRRNMYIWCVLVCASS